MSRRALQLLNEFGCRRLARPAAVIEEIADTEEDDADVPQFVSRAGGQGARCGEAVHPQDLAPSTLEFFGHLLVLSIA